MYSSELQHSILERKERRFSEVYWGYLPKIPPSLLFLYLVYRIDFVKKNKIMENEDLRQELFSPQCRPQLKVEFDPHVLVTLG